MAPPPTAGLGPRRRRPGFLAGTGALFSGFGFVLKNPAVWPLALVPVAVAGLGTALVGAGTMHLLQSATRPLIGPDLELVQRLVQLVQGAVALVVGALVGFGVAQPLSGPALNRIVRRAEADLGAPARPPSGFFEDVLRALQSIAVAYGLGLPVLAVLFLITFFFPPAAVVTFPVKLVVLALLVSWDLCDYPLSAHGVPVGARVAFVGRNLGAMLGFGFGLGLLSLVPCALVLVLPAGVAGAARLTRRIELFEAGRG